jgi:hypothetical protein
MVTNMKLLLALFCAPALWATGNLVSVSPGSGTITPGTNVSMTVVMVDDGGENANQIAFNSSDSAANGCVLTFSDTYWSLMPNGGASATYYQYPFSSSASNSQCTVSGIPSGGPTAGGGNKSITFTINFSTGWQGSRTIYWEKSSNYFTYLAQGQAPYANTYGSINIATNQAPTTVNVWNIPANFRYGEWIAVYATVRDPDGWGNINYWHLLLNNGVNGSGACYFLLVPGGNYFHLINDTGDGWSGAITMGSGNYPQNRACVVSAPSSSFSNSGTDSTAVLWIYAKPDQMNRNPMYSYLWVVDTAGAGQAWGGAYTTSYVRSVPKMSN